MGLRQSQGPMPLAVLAALTNFAEESVMKGARVRAEREEGSSQVEGTEDVKRNVKAIKSYL